MNRFALATVGAVSMGVMIATMPGAAMACNFNSPTDTCAGPANVNPGNPLSSLNPASPYYPHSSAPHSTSDSEDTATRYGGGSALGLDGLLLGLFGGASFGRFALS